MSHRRPVEAVARLLHELEKAPAAERAAATQELNAWLRRNADVDRLDTTPLFAPKKLLLVTAAFALPLLLWQPMASAKSTRSGPILRREAASLLRERRGSVQPPQNGRMAGDTPEERRRDRHRAGVPEGGRRSYPKHEAFLPPHEGLRKLRPNRNTSDFPLLVAVGHGKTATKSLNKALVMLGMRTAHFYGAGIYGLLFDNAAEKADHEFLFSREIVDGVLEKHVDGVLDTPVVDFYNEIRLSYPNAKFILTIRDIHGWMRSQHKFYSFYARGCHNWLAPWRRGAAGGSNLVYGTECPSPEQALKRYLQHNRNVYDAIPAERLLVMDIPGGDGWEQLCPFIGRPQPAPNVTFPSRH